MRSWSGRDSQIKTFWFARIGSLHRTDYIFEIEAEPKKVVEGWVGVLKKGSRAKAGFSILHRKRLIRGWPDSWRPEKIFGVGGRNDLINQRVVGEVNLEDFEVSHTKDEINWDGLEEELVEEGLLKECKPFMETARKARRGPAVEHGPSGGAGGCRGSSSRRRAFRHLNSWKRWNSKKCCLRSIK